MHLSKEHRNQEILQNLKAILNRRGMSQRDLANNLGKKESEISRWFSGKFCISHSTQAKIENFLQEPISSDSTYRHSNGTLNIGVIGTGNIARRFAAEMSHVSYGKIAAAYNPDIEQLNTFCIDFNIENPCNNLQELIDLSDAIYIASPIETHAEYARICLNSSKHVLCEMPFTSTKEEAKELYRIANANNCTLMPALKTAYCPSFLHMNDIARSGIIGEVVEISAAVTTLLPENTPESFYNERLLENATYPLLAIFKLFGVHYDKIRIFNKRNGEKIDFSNISLEYNDRIATFKIGVGVKSEGSLTISGTNGYIYVPAPWWKTDYFEVRFENQNDNKKYFFPYESSGLRYEIQAFIDSVKKNSVIKDYLTKEENLKISEITTKISNFGK